MPDPDIRLSYPAQECIELVWCPPRGAMAVKVAPVNAVSNDLYQVKLILHGEVVMVCFCLHSTAVKTDPASSAKSNATKIFGDLSRLAFEDCIDIEALSEDPEWRNACCMGISVPDGDESYPRICAVGVAGTSEGRRRAALLALCIAALASPSPKVKRVRHLTDSEQEVANMFPGMMQRIQAVARGFLQKCRQAAFQLRFKDLLKARLAEDQQDRLASAFQQAWKNPCETKSYGALAPQADANCWRDPGWAIRVLDLPPTCTWWDVRDHCKRVEVMITASRCIFCFGVFRGGEGGVRTATAYLDGSPYIGINMFLEICGAGPSCAYM